MKENREEKNEACLNITRIALKTGGDSSYGEFNPNVKVLALTFSFLAKHKEMRGDSKTFAQHCAKL